MVGMYGDRVNRREITVNRAVENAGDGAINLGDELYAPVDGWLLGEDVVEVRRRHESQNATTQPTLLVNCVVRTNWRHLPSTSRCRGGECGSVGGAAQGPVLIE